LVVGSRAAVGTDLVDDLASVFAHRHDEKGVPAPSRSLEAGAIHEHVDVRNLQARRAVRA
jgi:hypothetical protein